MSVEINPGEAQRDRLTIKITGGTSVANGGQGYVANPEGVDLAVLRSELYIETPSTGAGNISAGIASAANGAGTDIINALAVNGSITGKIYNGNTIQATTKTEITVPAVWQDDYFLTITGSADLTGLVAYLFVEYIRLP